MGSAQLDPGTPRLRRAAVDSLSIVGAGLMLMGVAVFGDDLVVMFWSHAGTALTSVWDLLPSVLRPFAPDPYVDLLQAFPLSLALITLGAALYHPSWPRRRKPATTQSGKAKSDTERRLAA